MCEYCEKGGVKIGYNGDTEWANFCPNCGRPLIEPKPLTLEQLKQREGKPVWVTGYKRIAKWVIVDIYKSNNVHGDCLRHTASIGYPLNGYGKKWQAFDHEPHEVK